jgi:UDP-N-acetylglucosamine--N-acetylmuramyl-(pentapeptide) pyrophosphoryl-undecaprenol N-acetylglucosamine transferase
VRAEFYRVKREDSRALFQLDVAQPVLTVFGGSQGAHAINEAVRANLRELLALTQLVHITGRADESTLRAERDALSETEQSRYRVFGYLDQEMPQALAAADIVLARAGAATLGEFPAVGVPSILVPGTFAQGHQEKNADFLSSLGAALTLAEAKLAGDLVPTVASLLRDRERLDKMAAATRALSQPEAAKRIGNLLKQVAVA